MDEERRLIESGWGGSLAVEEQDCAVPGCPHRTHIRVILWNAGEGSITLTPPEAQHFLNLLTKILADVNE